MISARDHRISGAGTPDCPTCAGETADDRIASFLGGNARVQAPARSPRAPAALGNLADFLSAAAPPPPAGPQEGGEFAGLHADVLFDGEPATWDFAVSLAEAGGTTLRNFGVFIDESGDPIQGVIWLYAAGFTHYGTQPYEIEIGGATQKVLPSGGAGPVFVVAVTDTRAAPGEMAWAGYRMLHMLSGNRVMTWYFTDVNGTIYVPTRTLAGDLPGGDEWGGQTSVQAAIPADDGTLSETNVEGVPSGGIPEWELTELSVHVLYDLDVSSSEEILTLSTHPADPRLLDLPLAAGDLPSVGSLYFDNKVEIYFQTFGFDYPAPWTDEWLTEEVFAPELYIIANGTVVYRGFDFVFPGGVYGPGSDGTMCDLFGHQLDDGMDYLATEMAAALALPKVAPPREDDVVSLSAFMAAVLPILAVWDKRICSKECPTSFEYAYDEA